jgi:hypothetical protein
MIANMEAHKTGKTIREVAREKTDLSEVQLDELLDARKMTEASDRRKVLRTETAICLSLLITRLAKVRVLEGIYWRWNC